MVRPLPRSRSVFFRWLLSYLGLLLLLVLVNGFVYLQSTRALAGEINEGRLALLHQAQEAIGGRLADLEKISLQLSWNPRVRSFLYRAPPLDGSSYFLLTELNRDLQAIATGNSFVRELFVYFRRSGLALSTRTIARADLLSQAILDGSDRPLEEWLRLLNAPHEKEMLPVGRVVYFFQSLPRDSVDEPPATMVAVLDGQWLEATIHNPSWLEAESIFIVDGDNRLIASAGAEPIPRGILYRDVAPDGAPHMMSLDGRRYVASAVQSRLTDWKIVSVLPARVLLRKAIYVRDLTVVSLSICLALGGIMAWFFSRKNTLDLHRLMADMASLAGIRAEPGVNEYNFLKSAIAATLKERESNREALREFNSTMRANFLSRLLKGRLADAAVIEASLSAYAVRVDWRRFGVLIFYREGPGGGDEDARDRLSRAIIAHQVESLCAGRCSCAVADVDDMLVVLAGGLADTAELASIAGEAQAAAAREAGAVLTVAVSDCHRGAHESGVAFQEALDALEHKLVRGKGAIIEYRTVGQAARPFDFTLEAEERLANAIRSGDTERAEDRLDAMMERGLTTETSMQGLKCFVFDVYNALVRSFAGAPEDRRRVLLEMASPCLKLADASSLEELKERLRDALRDVCGFMQGVSRDTRLAEAVRRYVLESYPDPNLSIAVIADHFRLTQGYISRLFRDSAGESLLDFIHKVRVRAAKNMIGTQRASLGQVAQAVGYGSSNALIRAFKKLEGITPGRYKAIA